LGRHFFKQRYLLTYFLPRKYNDIANVSLSGSQRLQKGSNLRIKCARIRLAAGRELKHSLPRTPSRNEGPTSEGGWRVEREKKGRKGREKMGREGKKGREGWLPLKRAAGTGDGTVMR